MPDTLHILDLAVSQDAILSFLIEWMMELEPSFRLPADGRRRKDDGRHAALDYMRDHYKEWAQSSGILHAERVADKLWTVTTLVPKSGKYPAVSSKVMKGAAASLLAICSLVALL